MAFIAAELIGLKLDIPKKRLLAIIPLAIVVIIYLTSLEFGLKDYLVSVAPNFHVQLKDSWTWMWDFIIIAAFFMISMTILFGKRWIRVSPAGPDRKSTRLNSSHPSISYAVFCLKKK